MVHVGTQFDLDTKMLTLLDNANTSRFDLDTKMLTLLDNANTSRFVQKNTKFSLQRRRLLQVQ